MRRSLATALAFLAVLAFLTSPSQAAQSVRLTAGFIPDRLNTPATISFEIQVSAAHGVPAPMTTIDLRYPVDLGLGTSGLGLATCQPSALDTFGPAGCPANSVMGRGTAIAEIPFSQDVIEESANITLLAGPSQQGHLDILVYADAHTPVSAQLNFSALLFPEPPPFGGRLHFDVPIVPSIPNAPDVAIVRLQTTLGPLGLTYYEQVRGRTHAFKPSGILLPSSCPNGGFPFTANLGFQDGSHARARTTVPCPTRTSTRHRHG